VSERPSVIIGGGISGLTAAYRLHQAGRPFVLLEGSAHLGGNIHTATHDGFVYDLGPDSFLKAKPAGVELIKDLGLEDQMISPSPGGGEVFVARDGALHPMPEGLSLGVPRKPGPLMDTPLLSGPAKLRAMMEPFVKRPSLVGEETIFDFMKRRLGAEMAERLAAPLLSGVFAGDATKLSMDATFPQLIALEKKYGSLFSGMNGGKSIFEVLFSEKKKVPSPFVTLKGGLGALVEALICELPLESVQTLNQVTGIERRESGFLVSVEGPEGARSLDTEHVIVAGPPWSAARILSSLDDEIGRTLAKVRGFHTATVFFALDPVRAERDLSGSGFIVPPGEGEVLAATFISSKWAGRAPEGKALIRAFVGGARTDVSSWSDDEVESLAHRELTRLMGSLGPVQFSRVHRYSRGTPQPEMGHLQRLDTVKARLEHYPGLSLVGSGYGGVGIPDCIRQANEAVEKIVGG